MSSKSHTFTHLRKNLVYQSFACQQRPHQESFVLFSHCFSALLLHAAAANKSSYERSQCPWRVLHTSTISQIYQHLPNLPCYHFAEGFQLLPAIEKRKKQLDTVALNSAILVED